MFKRPKKSIHSDFAIIDSQFPQKNPRAFRNAEINEYLGRITNCQAYTMYPMKPDAEAGFGHSYGMEPAEFKKNLRGYATRYRQYKNRVHCLRPDKQYRFKLAYSFFLAETYVLLPFYEAQQIPFMFVLYPGGLFGLNSKESDYMLQKICSSQYFRGLIATQKITENYLLEHRLCPPEKINFVYGGIAQFKVNDVLPRHYFGNDKQTFDICFVAAKYSERGVDKGYDLFIEVAKKLSLVSDDFRFHVVGGFDAGDIDVSGIQDKIIFYGYQDADFLLEFYSGMDVFLSPNRPFQLFNGNFDGFPLGNDAGFCGVALFVADELAMNTEYQPDEDIVIVPLSATKIAKKLAYYHQHPDALRTLAQKGQVKSQALFDVKNQTDQRIAVFNKYVTLDFSDRTVQIGGKSL